MEGASENHVPHNFRWNTMVELIESCLGEEVIILGKAVNEWHFDRVIVMVLNTIPCKPMSKVRARAFWTPRGVRA